MHILEERQNSVLIQSNAMSLFQIMSFSSFQYVKVAVLQALQSGLPVDTSRHLLPRCCYVPRHSVIFELIRLTSSISISPKYHISPSYVGSNKCSLRWMVSTLASLIAMWTLHAPWLFRLCFEANLWSMILILIWWLLYRYRYHIRDSDIRHIIFVFNTMPTFSNR